MSRQDEAGGREGVRAHAQMPQVKTSYGQRIFLVICGFIIVVLSSECLLRAFDVDVRLLRKFLYYQSVFLPMHGISADAHRLYALRPGASMKGATVPHVRGAEYNMIDIAINNLGFRDRPRERVKPPGVFRIVFLGGSNTFGALVRDEDTYPAYLQKMFDEKHPGKVEVWNAGLCGYEMSQDVAYAEALLREFAPDLVVFQDTNRGRRPFLVNVTFSELKRFFKENKELFAENIPPPWQVEPAHGPRQHYAALSIKVYKTHYSLVDVSALYRVFCVAWHACHFYFSKADPRMLAAKNSADFAKDYGQMVSDRDLNAFTRRHKDKKIVLFYINARGQEIGKDGVEIRDNVKVFVLDAGDKPSEYREIHPPAHVYAWYAQELYDFLMKQGYFQ